MKKKSLVLFGMIGLLSVAMSGPTNAAEAPAPAVQGCDLNGDGYQDLAIGVPGDTIAKVEEAGSVQVIYGTAEGLSPDGVDNHVWHRAKLDVNGRTQKSDQFGLSVTCGDFDADGYDEVAIGVPTDTINGQADAGSVHILCGTAAGLSRFGDQVWHRNRAFVNGNAQPDRFGFALTSGDFDGDGHADLAVGAPNDLVSGVGGAGSAQVLLSPTRTSMRCRTMVR